MQLNYETPTTSRQVTQRAVSSSNAIIFGLSSSLENSVAGPGRPSGYEASRPFSANLANRIIDPMGEQKYLESNAVEVMICLFKMYSRALGKSPAPDPPQGGTGDFPGRRNLGPVWE